MRKAGFLVTPIRPTVDNLFVSYPESGKFVQLTLRATDHYLYFRGIPNPPDAYIPPTGASVNTWPNIYNNLLDIDFCVVSSLVLLTLHRCEHLDRMLQDHFAHLGNRVKCMEEFGNAGPMLS